MASNSWVISGKHTETGYPILENDPHLSSFLPNAMTLNELVWDGGYVIGASVVGGPGVHAGRNKNVSWASTTPRTDIADMWEEEIDADFTHYMVDGHKREIKKIVEQIKVKGEDDIDFEIGFTHRGPIMEKDLLKYGAELFNKGVAKTDRSPYYSFGWGANVVPGDKGITVINIVNKSTSVK